MFFIEVDIVGIQNFGEGSKGDDLKKIGQFGVGFNVVYYLIDVFLFVFSGEEIGDILCVLDLYYKYVFGVIVVEFGMMFREILELK